MSDYVFRPILFSGPMVRAILAGAKSQTRRVITRQNTDLGDGPCAAEFRAGLDFDKAWVDPGLGDGPYLKVPHPPTDTVHRVYPRWSVGDLLWVREAWQPYLRGEGDDGFVRLIRYCADDAELTVQGSNYAEFHAIEAKGYHKRSPIFMPRWASRIELAITAIRPERLQNISAQDAFAEGAVAVSRSDTWHDSNKPYPIHAFHKLWDSLNAKRGHSWEANDWVWVVEFKMEKAQGNGQ